MQINQKTQNKSTFTQTQTGLDTDFKSAYEQYYSQQQAISNIDQLLLDEAIAECEVQSERMMIAIQSDQQTYQECLIALHVARLQLIMIKKAARS